MIDMKIDNLKFVEGDYTKSDDFSDLIYDNDGSHTLNDESMYFEIDGVEVLVKYSLYLEGRILEESGDWYTPSSTEITVDEVDVDINSVLIDDTEINLNKEDYKRLTKLIEKFL